MWWMMLEKVPGIATLRGRPCLDRKSAVANMDGLTSPYFDLEPTIV
jgi:hypothetical protein